MSTENTESLINGPDIQHPADYLARRMELVRAETGLPPLGEVEEGMVVFGSGSPRLGRARRLLPNLPLTCLPSGSVAKTLEQLKGTEYEKIGQAISDFVEPPANWKYREGIGVDDGGISQKKARMALATALLKQHPKLPPVFRVVGRDFVVGTPRGDFFDKADYPESKISRNPLPKNRVEPLDVLLALYDDPNKPFVFANSATCLTFDPKALDNFPSPEQLTALINLENDPPSWVRSSTAHSFMAGKQMGEICSRSSAVHPRNLFSDLLQSGYKESDIYNMPGIFCWQTLGKYLAIGVAENGPHFADFHQLQLALLSPNTAWLPSAEVISKYNGVADEIVGFPYACIKKLVQGN